MKKTFLHTLHSNFELPPYVQLLLAICLHAKQEEEEEENLFAKKAARKGLSPSTQ